jgi:hypothetical protein
MSNTDTDNKSIFSFLSFKINVFELAVLGLAVYLAFAAHQANVENSKKINQLLVKYEKTLDAAISGDPTTLKAYRDNLHRAVEDLSPEERKILESVLALSTSGSNK